MAHNKAPLTGLFSDQLAATPTKPGVYIMKGHEGNILYVGKAANLRSRIRSYFRTSSGLTAKIKRMVSLIVDFECIITDTAAEALILECTLIKRHRPLYNARLKDDKNYPYLKIDLKEDFPQVYITRKVEPDGSRYFGPFATAWSIRRTMDILKKLFPYRSCTKPITGRDPRPCLDHYIHRCVAPCIGAVSKEEYHKVIQQVLLFLEGKTEPVLETLRSHMEIKAASLQFEQAAILRDQIRAIQRVTNEQTMKVASTSGQDLDAISIATGIDESWMELFFIRQGKLIGRDHFIMEATQENSQKQIIGEFITQFYDSASYIPPLVLVPTLPENTVVIEEWLTQKSGRKVSVEAPQRGEKRKLVMMVGENATQELAQRRAKFFSRQDLLDQALHTIQEQLNLPRPLQRIECYDISNTQGSNPVGSMVVFENGKPKPADYRKFKIRTVDRIDDYAMIKEVLHRRFTRLASLNRNIDVHRNSEPVNRNNRVWHTVPDLVLIDGGKGHLSIALQVFLEIGIDFVPLASIAKQREELFVPQTPEPIVLARNSQSRFLIQRIRDEAHRFALAYHQKLRSRQSTRSVLDTVPGIGPKRRILLLRRFRSIDGLREAAIAELTAIPGITPTIAQLIKQSI